MQQNTLKLIVTGTGRCGTGYTAKVLNMAGVKTGHEGAFTFSGPKQHHDLVADVSWMAMPYLHKYPNAVRLHIYREPEACIASLERVGIPTGPNPYHAFARRHSAAVSAKDFYYWWNEQCRVKCDMSVRIEELDYNVLSGVLQDAGIMYDDSKLRQALAVVPHNINTR